MKESQELKLSVSEAQQDDVNKGIIRIDSAVMKQIGVEQGAIVEIEGEKKTVAIAGRAFPADIGLAIIRMDSDARRNAGTSIGEKVVVRKAEEKPAKRVMLAPSQKGIMIQMPPAHLKNSLLGRAVSKGDVISLGGTSSRRRTFSGSPFEDIFSHLLSDEGFGGAFGFGGLRLVVVSTAPKEAVYITEDTEVSLSSQAVELKEEESIPEIAYEDIGGLDEEIKKVREMIELPLKHEEIFTRLGVSPPKGVLLHGPPGTGKTLIAKAVAHESGAHFILINGPEIVSKFYGEAEKNIRKKFEEAEKNAPAIIFIDEIDAIAPKREESYGEVERRIVAQLLATMDGLKSRGKVIVIAATNRPDALDPALRRGGRFDREIEVGVPNKKGRLDILKIHTRNMPLAKNVDLKKLAEITHGYVGADLEGLVKEAAMSVLRRLLPQINIKEGEKISEEVLNKLIVNNNDFKDGLKLVTPSAMREVLVEAPKTKWSDIGGLDKAKQELQEAVEWPLKNPEAFKRIGITPPKGVLLYGPSGCGKTLLAKAVATESEANFISVKGPEVLSKWVGESEKGIRKIFKKARQVSPSIIFFDEIDSIAAMRGMGEGSRVSEKVVNQILTEIDGLEELNDVVVIAATNRPELVDSALLRPGRFDRHVLIMPPEEKGRLEILKLHTGRMTLAKTVSLTQIAKYLVNYSGADIEAVCREAGMQALREDIKADKVEKKHFDKAMKEVTASLSKGTIGKYAAALKAATSRAQPKTPDYMG